MSYVNPSSLMGLAVAFFNIASILVILRLLGRRMQRMRIGPDDILLVVSWTLMLVMSIDMITAVAYGIWGKPLPPRIDSKGRVDPVYGMSPLLSQSYEFFFFQELIFPVQLMFAKLSILFFYRRIFCTTSKRDYAHWATLVVIVLTCIWGVGMFFVYLFQCGTRISVSWASPLIEVAEYCLPGNIEVLMSGSDFTLDMLIFLLPLPRLATLQLPTHKKVLVFAAFAVGGITMAASLVRLVMYVQLLNGANGQLATLDENMLISTVMYWGMFEAGFAVSTACLPSIQYMVIKAGTGVRDAVLSGRATPFRSIRDRSLASSSDGRKGSLFSWNRKGSNLWKISSDRKGSTGSSSTGGFSHVDPKDLESGQGMGMGMNYGIRAPLEPISYNRTDVYASY